MLIGVRKRFIFVANTKTASTSIENMIASQVEIMRGGSPRQKHIMLRDVRKEYWFLFDRPDHAFDTYFKFGVMRDPIDWIVSWYRYRKGNKTASPLPETMTFADFWAERDWNIQRANGEPYLQQDLFVAADGTLLADMIIPYGNLQEGLHGICQRLQMPMELLHHNVSAMASLPEPLSPALIEEMRAYYAKDYALFDRLEDINAIGIAKLLDRR